LLQRLGGLAEFLLIPGVLGLEIGADFLVQRLGPLHHLLPVAGAQPRIGVLTDDAMVGVLMRDALGERGRGLGHEVSGGRQWQGHRAPDDPMESDRALYLFIIASDASENRFALFGPMLQASYEQFATPRNG